MEPGRRVMGSPDAKAEDLVQEEGMDMESQKGEE